MSHDHETIGDRVRRLREARNISRASLARQVGVHRATVHRFETTPLYKPDVVTLQRFASALGVTVQYLQTGCWDEDVSELAGLLQRDGRLDAEKSQIMLAMFDSLLRLQQAERNLVWMRFVQDRDAAFHTLDRTRIQAFYHEYALPVKRDEDAFWIDVHEIRTGITSLPADERRLSEDWLRSRGLVGLNDDSL